MANPEHVEILRQGAEVWNRWRGENPDVIPDLIHTDLKGMELSYANICKADLYESNLFGANLSRADLIGANLNRTNLSRSNLSHADLSRAKLQWSTLRRANLCEAKLVETDLTWVNFGFANLSKASFDGAFLVGAIFDEANLSGTNLSEAELAFANFCGTKLNETNLERIKVGHTVFGDVDLRKAKGLENVHHYGPSTVGIETIYVSVGKIPETFFRGCGVPEKFIQYMSSLTGKAFEYYSCFISYSSKDQDFAERLHADLQINGVRCWFAPEDMKIGDKIRDRIDQSIRIHDKLLLILSENSINSEWVEDEVEAAYEQERQRGETVLFPIRLDPAVMDTDKAWAAKLKRSRHIGDFTQWKDHDAYQKAFDRLMRDLKAEGPAGSD